MRGRVATLLEVGTGFHPELTGRENIFVNGAILGMRRREIEAKFDEIVDFSGIERFIDTPVKRYSSGMYVRLAFAVAAHLEPEILLVDEVLAVGDAEFQRKCLGKMQEVSEHGRTVVFVSHNLSAVQRLCSRAYWIGGGQIAGEGPTASEVVAAYMRASGSRRTAGRPSSAPTPTASAPAACGCARRRWSTRPGEPVSQLAIGERFGVRMHFEVFEPIDDAVVELGISGPDGTRVLTAHNLDRDGTSASRGRRRSLGAASRCARRVPHPRPQQLLRQPGHEAGDVSAPAGLAGAQTDGEVNVAVVIPVRDGERYLAEALDSVLVQTHAPCDIVVVDDGSTDRTVGVAERYAPRVRCISQRAAGIGAARNRGVAEARGEYLAFLDGDDAWPVDRLERQLAAFSARPRPDLVFGHIEQFVSPELDAAVRAKLVCPGKPQPAFLANTMLMPRAVWDRVGSFSTAAVRSEFLDWLLRAREHGLREIMLDDVVLRRRLHGANHGRVQHDAAREYATTLKRALDRRRAAGSA